MSMDQVSVRPERITDMKQTALKMANEVKELENTIEAYKKRQSDQAGVIKELNLTIIQQRKDAGGIGGPERERERLANQIEMYESKLIRVQEALAVSRRRGERLRFRTNDLNQILKDMYNDLTGAQTKLNNLSDRLEELRLRLNYEHNAKETTEAEMDKFVVQFAKEKELWKNEIRNAKEDAKVMQKEYAAGDRARGRIKGVAGMSGVGIADQILNAEAMNSKGRKRTTNAQMREGFGNTGVKLDRPEDQTAQSGNSTTSSSVMRREGNLRKKYLDGFSSTFPIPEALRTILGKKNCSIELLQQAFDLMKKHNELTEKIMDLVKQIKKMQGIDNKEDKKNKTIDEELRKMKMLETKINEELCTIAKTIIIAYNGFCKIAKLIECAISLGMDVNLTQDTDGGLSPNLPGPVKGGGGAGGNGAGGGGGAGTGGAGCLPRGFDILRKREKEKQEKPSFKQIIYLEMADTAKSPQFGVGTSAPTTATAAQGNPTNNNNNNNNNNTAGDPKDNDANRNTFSTTNRSVVSNENNTESKTQGQAQQPTSSRGGGGGGSGGTAASGTKGTTAGGGANGGQDNTNTTIGGGGNTQTGQGAVAGGAADTQHNNVAKTARPKIVFIDQYLEDYDVFRKLPELVPSFDTMRCILNYIVKGTFAIADWNSIHPEKAMHISQSGSLIIEPNAPQAQEQHQASASPQGAGGCNLNSNGIGGAQSISNIDMLLYPLQFSLSSKQILFHLNIESHMRASQKHFGVVDDDLPVDKILALFDKQGDETQKIQTARIKGNDKK